jgi:hypothetical protein
VALDPVKLRICSGRAVGTLRRPLVAVQRCNTAVGDNGSSSKGGSSSSDSESSELGDTAHADAAHSAAEGDAISAAAAVDVTVPVVRGHADAAVFGAAAGVSVEQHHMQQQHEQQHDDSHVRGSAVEPWWLQRGSGRAADGVTVLGFCEELVEGGSALQCRCTSISCCQAALLRARYRAS